MKRKTLGVLAVSVCFVALIAGVLFLTRSESCPFSMQVIPENTMNSIAGQKCVFLVVVADEGEGSGEGEAVNISATVPGAAVTVYPQTITPGQVAEVTVVAPIWSVPSVTLTVNIKGERGGLAQTEISTIVVEMGEDALKPHAAEVRDSFISWLAANHPEFGITGETEWTGTIVVPYTFEVSYYLYFSEDWEMGVRWHVTIVPDDWAEIYLRKRFTETQPSHAFKIDSYETYKTKAYHAIDPPESVWRTLSQENGVVLCTTHISFSPRFYELVEEYGGGWEDENGQIHGR
ncbi:hypothetical protein ES703_00781 [subsurface metagenome]